MYLHACACTCTTYMYVHVHVVYLINTSALANCLIHATSPLTDIFSEQNLIKDSAILCCTTVIIPPWAQKSQSYLSRVSSVVMYGASSMTLNKKEEGEGERRGGGGGEILMRKEFGFNNDLFHLVNPLYRSDKFISAKYTLYHQEHM